MEGDPRLGHRQGYDDDGLRIRKICRRLKRKDVQPVAVEHRVEESALTAIADRFLQFLQADNRDDAAFPSLFLNPVQQLFRGMAHGEDLVSAGPGSMRLGWFSLRCPATAALVVPACLGAVAAIRHVAPTPAVVLGRIQEQPTASPVIGALADPLPPLRGQQIRRRTQDRPQHAFEFSGA